MRIGLTGIALDRGGSGQYIGFCCLPDMGGGEGISVLNIGKPPERGDMKV